MSRHIALCRRRWVRSPGWDEIAANGTTSRTTEEQQKNNRRPPLPVLLAGRRCPTWRPAISILIDRSSFASHVRLPFLDRCRAGACAPPGHARVRGRRPLPHRHDRVRGHRLRASLDRPVEHAADRAGPARDRLRDRPPGRDLRRPPTPPVGRQPHPVPARRSASASSPSAASSCFGRASICSRRPAPRARLRRASRCSACSSGWPARGSSPHGSSCAAWPRPSGAPARERSHRIAHG